MTQNQYLYQQPQLSAEGLLQWFREDCADLLLGGQIIAVGYVALLVGKKEKWCRF